MAARAAIFGSSGLKLTEEERRFFADADPLGYILFARNIETPDQVKALVADFRAVVGRDDAPVLIDQEGGRVQRLRPPHWRAAPPGSAFATLAASDPERAVEAARLNARLVAAELVDLGIDVDCWPVLDVPQADAHSVIGDRALGTAPAQVARLGRAICDGLLDGGVLPVVKHVPGHGRARSDSHEMLPVVTSPLAELEAVDFAPFKALADMPWAMTAHVVYTAIDPDRPATTSKKAIAEAIRMKIGFGGVLLSDDIGMKALSGGFRDKAEAVLAAGCDIVLHCSGVLDEMREVAVGTGLLGGPQDRRLARARACKRRPQAFDSMAGVRRLDALLADRRERA